MGRVGLLADEPDWQTLALGLGLVAPRLFVRSLGFARADPYCTKMWEEGAAKSLWDGDEAAHVPHRSCLEWMPYKE